MHIIKLNENGYNEALYGLGLNKKLSTPFDNYASITPDLKKQLQKVAKKLSVMDGGHNNFLESIQTWWSIQAPLYWWKQMDRYRTKSQQSESTMHTILSCPIKQTDFELPILESTLDGLNSLINDVNHCIKMNDNEWKEKLFQKLNNNLPQGYLQKRVVCISYKCLRNILKQRSNHKLGEWNYFCLEILNQIEHPEFLIEEK